MLRKGSGNRRIQAMSRPVSRKKDPAAGAMFAEPLCDAGAEEQESADDSVRVS